MKLVDSAGSNTGFPRWAIGLIVIGVLLIVAAAIIIGRCVINKQNEGRGESGDQIQFESPRSVKNTTVEEEIFIRQIKIVSDCDAKKLQHVAKLRLTLYSMRHIAREPECEINMGIFCDIFSRSIGDYAITDDIEIPEQIQNQEEIKKGIVTALNDFIKTIENLMQEAKARGEVLDKKISLKDQTNECIEQINLLKVQWSDERSKK